MKTVILIGGTFNPITKAHLQMGILVKSLFPEAEVHYILSNMDFTSKWKKTAHGESFPPEGREELVREAITPYGFILQNKESTGELSGATYDTVMYYKSIGYEKIYFCIGYDKLKQINRWKKSNNLAKEVTLLLFERDGKTKKDAQEDLSRWDIIEIPMCKTYDSISSTKIRNAFYAGNLEQVKNDLESCTYETLQTKYEQYMKNKGDIYKHD